MGYAIFIFTGGGGGVGVHAMVRDVTLIQINK